MIGIEWHINLYSECILLDPVPPPPPTPPRFILQCACVWCVPSLLLASVSRNGDGIIRSAHITHIVICMFTVAQLCVLTIQILVVHTWCTNSCLLAARVGFSRWVASSSLTSAQLVTVDADPVSTHSFILHSLLAHSLYMLDIRAGEMLTCRWQRYPTWIQLECIQNAPSVYMNSMHECLHMLAYACRAALIC